MGIPYAEVIGDPIAHSQSPVIHGFWLEKLGLEGEYRRSLVPPEDLEAFLITRRADPDWRGCNLTMPLKEAVLPFLDETDREVREAMACNTIVNENGKLRGYNTDVLAVAELLSTLSRPNRPGYVTTYVHIIGAGGAARAAARGAWKSGWGDIEFSNRTLEKAQRMALWMGLPEDYGTGLDGLSPVRSSDDLDGRGSDVTSDGTQGFSTIFVNASCMGMAEFPDVPIDLAEHPADTVVFDMVYHPVETTLLKSARSLGLRTFDGLEMLVAQAAIAFEHLFGAPAPRQHDAELRRLLTS